MNEHDMRNAIRAERHLSRKEESRRALKIAACIFLPFVALLILILTAN